MTFHDEQLNYVPYIYTYYVIIINLFQKIIVYEFLIISTVARIPSVISSVLVGDNLSDGNIVTSILIFSASAVLGFMGVYAYNKFVDKHQKKKVKD